jgi:signal transduction histidine kinase
VARGLPPDELFAAVAREVRALLRADGARLTRYEPDGGTTVVAVEGEARIGSWTTAPIVVEGALWGMIEAGWQHERDVAPVVSERIRQFTDLVATAIANAHSRAELTASRARVVAAADAERRRIERNLHDGTQQRLVALALRLRVAEAQAGEAAPHVREQIAAIERDLVAAVSELQELSRGIHPTILTRGGLAPALEVVARRSSLAIELDADVPGRLDERVEVAAYYLVSEALTTAAKHARAQLVRVRAQARDDALEVEISDDGIGGADPRRGTGLTGLDDRVQAIGGRLEITSLAGRGTTVRAVLPLVRAPDLDPARDGTSAARASSMRAAP